MTQEETNEFLKNEIEHLRSIIEALEKRVMDLEEHREFCTTQQTAPVSVPIERNSSAAAVPQSVHDCGGGPVFVDGPIVLDATIEDTTKARPVTTPPTTILAIEAIRNGWPNEEGARLAAYVAGIPNLNWNKVTIDVQRIAPAKLISAFFAAFFTYFRVQRSDIFFEAAMVQWKTLYPFQSDMIETIASPFRTEALLARNLCHTPQVS